MTLNFSRTDGTVTRDASFGLGGGYLAPPTDFMGTSSDFFPSTITLRRKIATSPHIFGSAPITAPVLLKSIQDDSSDNYAETDIMFARIDASENNEFKRHTLAAIWNLNTYAEEACRERAKNTLLPKMTGKRHEFEPNHPLVASFPTTTSDFMAQWQFVGVMSSGEGSKHTSGNLISVITKGRARIANLWGDVHLGDSVGFLLKEAPSSFKCHYDWKGDERSSEPTKGKYMWLRPYSCGPSGPVHCSRFLNPQDEDISYVTSANVTQTAYREINGIVTDEEDPLAGKTRLTYKKWAEGAFIEIGTVISRPGAMIPGDELARFGARTMKGYRTLINSGYEIDISVTPFDCEH
jgi:hypothetical protein